MRKAIKISGYVLGGIVALLLLLTILIQTPWGEDQVRKQAVSFLTQKLHTKVAIGRIHYRLLNHFELRDVFVADRQEDTLLYLHQLTLDWHPRALLSGKILVKTIYLDGLNAHIYRPRHDTNFNYQFIMDAFAGGEEAGKVEAKQQKPSSSGSFLRYDVQKVALSNIRFRYDDTAGGTLFSARLGKAFLRPTLLNIDANQYALREINLSDVTTTFNTDSSVLPPAPPDTSAPSDFQIAVENISLANIRFSMLSRTDSMFFAANVGKFQGSLDHFGLLSEEIKAGRLTLEQVTSKFISGKSQPGKVASEKEETASDNPEESNNWKIWAEGLSLNDVGFILDDPNTPRQPSGMDYSHLDFRQVYLSTGNAYYSMDSTYADLKHLALREQCGLNVMDLRAQAFYTNHGAVLKDFYLQTPNSVVQDYLSIHYASLEALSNHLEQARLGVRLKNSRVGMNDVLLFLPPEQQEQFLPYQNQHLDIIADLNGYMDRLKLNRLYLSGLNGTVVDVKGLLNGLPDADKLAYDFGVQQIRTTRQDLLPFLPDSLRQQFLLPDSIAITGKVHGTTEDYYPDLHIRTSDGNVSVQGKLLLSPGTDQEQYDLAVQTTGLNVGKILKQDSLMGRITASVQAKGVSFNPKKMDNRAHLHIQSAWLMGYDYKNIILDALVKNKAAVVEGRAADPNLSFQLVGMANLQQEYPAVQANLDLKNADLNALKLTEDTLRLAGAISASFSSLNPDYPAGSFLWQHPFIDYNGKMLYPDDISIKSQPDADSVQNIVLNLANLLYATGSGHIPLSKFGEVIEAHINRYYHLADSLEQTPLEQYDFAFDGQVRYQPVLRQLVPELAPFDTILFNSRLDNDTFGLTLNGKKIIYGNNTLDSIALKVEEHQDHLTYLASLRKIETPAMALWYPYLGGVVRNDSVYAVVNIDDSLKEKQFTFGGAYYQGHYEDSTVNYFKLFKGLRFNYDIWSVNPENIFAFSPKGFYIQNLDLAHDSQSLSINSEYPVANAPLNINIQHFSLANITRMFSKDTLLADGMLDVKGRVDLSDSSSPQVNASAFISNLKAYNIPLGDLSAKVQNKDNQTLSAYLSLDGEGNHLQVYGDYYLKPVDGNDFDLNLLIRPLYLSSLQGLTFGALKNSSGTIDGQLAIKGTVEKPAITGSLQTHQLTTTVSTLNAYFKMPSEHIDFEPRKISFDNFHIEDKGGHAAVLNGDVYTGNFKEYFLNLNFNAQRWQALNSQKRDNPEYYGQLVLSANLNLKGMATAPKIDGNVVIHDSTDLHYALLDTGPGVVESEGIVKFVDSRDSIFPVVDSTDQERRRFHLSPSTELNVNVDVNKDATFTILIDPSTGDELQISGDAALNAFMDPSGTIGLTGTYQVNKGYYELNYNFLHRQFEIQDGSTVTLSGDPLDAEANITAVFNTDVAPYDLVENIAPQDQLAYFKQRLPFQIVLKIKGRVMQPEISFDIVLPEDKLNVVSANVSNLVQAKLADIRNNPSELNKQVFAVLILNKFLASDPFSSGSGLDVEHAARKSASRFLSDQLNRIATHLVRGLELNFDLNSTEDYSTGVKNNQTDLNVSASKNLFNDRLKVTVGNDFLLEGENAPRQQSSLIPGNLSVSYLLTKDGRYQASAYRTNELQDIVNGYVVETGLKLKLMLSYNKFKYLFVNPRKYFARQRAKHNREKAIREQNNESGQSSEKGDETEH